MEATLTSPRRPFLTSKAPFYPPPLHNHFYHLHLPGY